MFTYTFRKRKRKEKQSRVGLGVKIGIRGLKTPIHSKQLGSDWEAVNIYKGRSLLFWLRILINPMSKHDNLKMIYDVVFI